MSDRSNNNNGLAGMLALGIGAAVGIGALVYALSKNEEEQQSATVQPTHQRQLLSCNTYPAAPERYEDPCSMQIPDGKRITYVVETVDECRTMARQISQHCEKYRVLGFDCEKPQDGDVALLQLATHKGVCVLIRLCNMPCIPEELKRILADRKIIKVGVGARDDAQFLTNMDITVKGTLDLRYVAKEMNKRPGTLRAMTQQILGYSLVNGLRHSDWEAFELDKRHRDYAAEDALAGVEIFKKLERIMGGGLFEFRDTDSFLEKFQSKIDEYYY